MSTSDTAAIDHHNQPGQHLRQATYVSMVGGILIVCLSTALIALGGLHWPWTWVVVITYFVCIHGALVLFGMFALAKAMAGQEWRVGFRGSAIDVPHAAQ